ncbi:MAG: VOC family protein [Rhizobiaceae bacterium]|nr:VOC family protein [Rhizobiaceae bacterium]
MAVLRIVPNLRAADPPAFAAFYRDLFGLDIVMDHGWIATLAAPGPMSPQLSLASEGGGGTDVPAISIEVDDVDRMHALALDRGCAIVHPLTDEPWGVRRFFLRDPAGHIVNVLGHSR